MSVEVPQPTDITHRVLAAVAEAEDVDPVDLEPPLYDVLDGGLLDDLIASNHDCVDGPSLQLAFSYHGYHVHVDATGSVSIETN